MSRAWTQRTQFSWRSPYTPRLKHTPGRLNWARQVKQGEAWEDWDRGENWEQSGGDMGQTGKKEVISGDSKLLGRVQEEMVEPKSAWQQRWLTAAIIITNNRTQWNGWEESLCPGEERLKMRGEEGEQVGVWLKRNAYTHKTGCRGNTGKSVIWFVSDLA